MITSRDFAIFVTASDSFSNTRNLYNTMFLAVCRNFILQVFLLLYTQLLSRIAQNIKMALESRALKFGSDLIGITLYLAHRFELTVT